MGKWEERTDKDDRELTVRALNAGYTAFHEDVYAANLQDWDRDQILEWVKLDIAGDHESQPVTLGELREKLAFTLAEIREQQTANEEGGMTRRDDLVDLFKSASDAMVQAATEIMSKKASRA